MLWFHAPRTALLLVLFCFVFYFPSAVAAECSNSDLNADGRLDITDSYIAQILFMFGDPSFDLNGDEQVTVLDWFQFLSCYLQPSNVVVACSDSDEGLVSETRGITQVTENGATTQSATDLCIGNELIEYSCGEDNSIVQDRLSCAGPCQLGACTTSNDDPQNTFYVDPLNGRDTNNGSSSSPWRTTQHAADQAPSGSLIYLRGGTYQHTGSDQYRGRVAVRISKPGLTFQAYPGETPLFVGTESLSQWVRCTSETECFESEHLSNIWRAPLPVGLDPHQMYVRDHEDLLVVAQSGFPADLQYFNNASTDDAWRQIPEQSLTSSSLQDPEIFTQTEANFWDGAEVLLWTCNNNIVPQTITGFDPQSQTIYFEEMTCWDYETKDRYLMWNHPSLIDHPGEYFLDKENGFIYLWPRDESRIDEVIFSARNIGFDLGSQDDTVIDGIHFTGFGGHGTLGSIRNYDGGGDYHVHNVTVRNTFTYDSSGSGVRIDGANSVLVQNNRVERTRSGRPIFLSSGLGSTIEGNFVEKGGGSALTVFGMRDTVIRDNIVLSNNAQHSNGITAYIGCENITIENNVVLDSKVSLTFQDSRNIMVRGNVFRNSGHTIAAWGPGEDGFPFTIGPTDFIQVENNTLLSDVMSGEGGTVHIHEAHLAMDVQVRNNIMPALSDGYSHSHNLLYRVPQNFSHGDQEAVIDTADLQQVFHEYWQDDFRLRNIQLVNPQVDLCTMASNGGAVGALPCVSCDEEPFSVRIINEATEGFENFEAGFSALVDDCSGGSAITSYEWEFDDGSSASASDLQSVQHNFSAGDYQVRVTVRDSAGNEASSSTPVRVGPLLEPDLIVYLPFEEDILDYSGRDLNGDFQGSDSPTFCSGSMGVGLELSVDATERVDIDQEQFDRIEEFTVALWARRRDLNQGGYLFYRHPLTMMMNIDASRNRLAVSAVTSESGTVTHNLTLPPADTEWHHYVLRYDGQALSVFLDGVPYGSSRALSGTLDVHGSWDLRLGFRDGSSPFRGAIDEFRAYDRALTAAEIQALAQR